MAVLGDGAVVYSADSHVIEPPDLWQRYIEPAFRDRAPRLETSVRGSGGRTVEGEFIVCDGLRPQPVATFAAAGVDPRERSRANRRGYADIRPGGWDPVERVKDQDVDGVALEVLYPSIAMPMFALSDAAFQQAVFAAYNSWVADYARGAPGRLVGIGLVGLDDLDWATAELQRIRKLGLRGVMISNDPRPARTYADPVFDGFWATAADLGMPVSLHILTGKTGTGFGRGPFLVDYMGLTHPVQLSLTALLTSGVFRRHPGLKVVSVENDIGWLAHFLYRLERAYHEFRYMLDLEDAVPPAEHFARHCYATFQDDPVGIETVDRVGADRLMWASDYPHGDSTWPHSRDTIERNFAGVGPATVRRITRDNVAELYALD